MVAPPLVEDNDLIDGGMMPQQFRRSGDNDTVNDGLRHARLDFLNERECQDNVAQKGCLDYQDALRLIVRHAECSRAGMRPPSFPRVCASISGASKASGRDIAGRIAQEVRYVAS